MEPGSSSDADLVSAARAGDTVSFGVLLQRYRAPLYALALGILGHGPQAQDAVHDAFLIALRRLDTLHDPAAFGGWLRAITRNVCLETFRGGAQAQPLEPLLARDTLRSPEPSLEERIDQLALKEWVWTALSELPETLRVPAMLRYFGTRATYEEIAAVLGIPLGTVKSRLNQVKLKLAEALLATADVDHSDARRLHESTGRYFAAALDQMNDGRGYDLFADAFSPDPQITFSDGSSLHGRRHLVSALEEDMEVGIKMHLSTVHASQDITILEASFENPPDDPHHCPPGTTQVHFRRNGKTERIRLHFAPRPSAESET